MNRNIPVMPACFALFLLQLAVPAWMIVLREITLRLGTPFKFETAPVDPVDAFRGRYVAIRVQESSVPTVSQGQAVESGQTVYATVENKTNGYARLAALSRERPASGDYIRAKAEYGGTVVLPLDRFYMNEKLAPKAEQAYRDNSRSGNRNAYVLVRVRHGDAVIENLFVDGKPIGDFLRESGNRETHGNATR